MQFKYTGCKMDLKTQRILKKYRKIVTSDDLSLQISLGCMEIDHKSSSLENVPNDLERYAQSELDLGLDIIEVKENNNLIKPQHLLDLISLAKEVVDNRYSLTTKTHPHFKTPEEIENYFDKRNRAYHQRYSHWPY